MGKVTRKSIRGEVDELDQASRRTFDPKVARWIVGLGAVSLVATLLLSALASDDAGTPNNSDAHPNSYSRSALGHRAFAEVLRALDFPTVVSRYRSAEKASRDKPLWVIEPDIETDAKRVRFHDLIARAVQRRVPAVVVLPKWEPPTDEDDDWVQKLEGRSTETPRVVLEEIDHAIGDANSEKYRAAFEAVVWRSDDAIDAVYLRGVETKWKLSLTPVQGITTSDDGPLEPVIEGSSGDAYPVLVARFKRAPVWVVSDPDLLNTMGLGAGDNALVVYHLMAKELVASGAVVDEVAHGFMRAESIWSELLRFPLVLATFHFAGLMALVLWASLLRFGKPAQRPPRVPVGKSTLLDNTATLLALGHNAGHGVREYFGSTLRAVARVYGLPSELTHEQRLSAVADLATRRGVPSNVHLLAVEAADIRDKRSDERRALQVARKIYTFRTEMIDGPQSSR